MRARDQRALLELLVVGGVVAAGIVAAPALREVFTTPAGTLRPAPIAASQACPPPRAQRQAAQ